MREEGIDYIIVDDDREISVEINNALTSLYKRQLNR